VRKCFLGDSLAFNSFSIALFHIITIISSTQKFHSFSVAFNVPSLLTEPSIILFLRLTSFYTSNWSSFVAIYGPSSLSNCRPIQLLYESFVAFCFIPQIALTTDFCPTLIVQKWFLIARRMRRVGIRWPTWPTFVTIVILIAISLLQCFTCSSLTKRSNRIVGHYSKHDPLSRSTIDSNKIKPEVETNDALGPLTPPNRSSASTNSARIGMSDPDHSRNRKSVTFNPQLRRRPFFKLQKLRRHSQEHLDKRDTRSLPQSSVTTSGIFPDSLTDSSNSDDLELHPKQRSERTVGTGESNRPELPCRTSRQVTYYSFEEYAQDTCALCFKYMVKEAFRKEYTEYYDDTKRKTYEVLPYFYHLPPNARIASLFNITEMYHQRTLVLHKITFDKFNLNDPENDPFLKVFISEFYRVSRPFKRGKVMLN
jgi:hypothetical protein